MVAAAFLTGGCAGPCREGSQYRPLRGEEEVKSYSAEKRNDAVAEFCASKTKSEGFKAVLDFATKGLGGRERGSIRLIE